MFIFAIECNYINYNGDNNNNHDYISRLCLIINNNLKLRSTENSSKDTFDCMYNAKQQ